MDAPATVPITRKAQVTISQALRQQLALGSSGRVSVALLGDHNQSLSTFSADCWIWDIQLTSSINLSWSSEPPCGRFGRSSGQGRGHSK